MPRIVSLSDTHGRHDALTVPDGDVLIHAGDEATEAAGMRIRESPWVGAGDGIDVEHVGCCELRSVPDRMWPMLRVFGHIHEGYGQAERRDTILVNVSDCDADSGLANPAVVVDLP
jgi:hypothetical protein